MPITDGLDIETPSSKIPYYLNAVAAPDHKSGSAFKGQLYFQLGQNGGSAERSGVWGGAP